MDPIGIAGLGAVVIATLGAGALLTRWATRHTHAAWRALARERGGRFRAGWLLGPTLDLEHESVAVTLQALTDDRGRMSTTVTATRPEAMWWEGARITAGPRATGLHPAFGGPADEALRATAAPRSLEVAEGVAALRVDGLVEDRAVLVALVALAARLVELPRWGPLHALEGARRLDLRRDAVEVERRGLTVRVEGAPWGGADGVMISATCERALPRFAIRIGADGALDGDPAPGLLRGAELAPPARLGDALLKLDGETLRLYARPAATAADLEATVAFLAGLAARDPAGGAFR